MKTAFRSLPRRSAFATGALAVLVILLATLAINGSLGTTKTHAATTLPTPSHVVVVMEENHSFNEIIGSSSAPCYWTYINTSETSTSTCYDHLYAKLRTSSGATIATVQSQCNLNTHGWTQYTFTVTSQLSAYAGQAIQVYFQGTTDYTLPTDFYVDDVALTVS